MPVETRDETIRYTADVVLLAAGHVLLIQRRWDPHAGSWRSPEATSMPGRPPSGPPYAS